MSITENFMKLFFSPDPQNKEIATAIYPGLNESVQQEIRVKFPEINLDDYLKEKEWRIKCGLCSHINPACHRKQVSHHWVYTCMKTGETLTEEKQKTGCRFFKDSGLPF